MLICPDDGAGVNFKTSPKSIRIFPVLQTDGAHHFRRFISVIIFLPQRSERQQKISECSRLRTKQEEFIKALLKVKKGECQIGHEAELAGGETHSGPEDYDAADSFDQRSSREADQSEGAACSLSSPVNTGAARDIYGVEKISSTNTSPKFNRTSWGVTEHFLFVSFLFHMITSCVSMIRGLCETSMCH